MPSPINVLAGATLWVLFGLLGPLVSCDITHWLNSNLLVRHLLGLATLFFLFIMVKPQSIPPHIATIWAQTIGIYITLIMMTKSKAYFYVPTLVLILIDQSLRLQGDYLQDQQKYSEIRKFLEISIYAMIVIGFISYGIYQYFDHGSDFDLGKFIFGFGCQPNKS